MFTGELGRFSTALLYSGKILVAAASNLLLGNGENGEVYEIEDRADL
jgi:hypothetical protein